MAASTAIDPALVDALYDRFSANVSEWHPSGRLGLAVSGGPDSVAMLLLFHDSFDDFEVATVDHGLRPEAVDECELVRSLCAERDIPCRVLRVQVAAGNVQGEARRARYAALETWAIERELSGIATAHHADDQAETLLMRLNRGSGLAGLAGIRRMTRLEQSKVWLVRPLLDFRREELRTLVEAEAAPFVTDPSNEDTSFDRVRIRQALATAEWLDPAMIARSAQHLSDAERTLWSMSNEIWKQSTKVMETEVTCTKTAWIEVNAYLLLRAVAQLGGELAHGEAAAFVERMARNGLRKANIAGYMVEMREFDFRVSPEPPRKTG